MIGVVIVNYNNARMTLRCVETLATYSLIDIIAVVDNRSTDESLKELSILNGLEKFIVLQSDKNVGYGEGNNIGFRLLSERYQCDYILVANPDTFVEEKTIMALYDFLVNHPDYTVAAPKMKNEKHEIVYDMAFRIPTKWQYIISNGIILERLFYKICYSQEYYLDKEYVDVDAVAGSLLMLRTSAFSNKPVYDSQIFLYCEEVCLGIKLRQLQLKTAIILNTDYIHYHKVSLNNQVDSIGQRKLLFNSRSYLLKEYYSASTLEVEIARLLLRISVIELMMVHMIAKCFRSYSKCWPWRKKK